MLTYQIHTIPNQNSYDELVKRVRSKSQEEDLESFFRKVLAHQGLLGADAWASPESPGTTTASA